MSNRNFYSLIVLGVLILFGAGFLVVNALTPGEAPNPGHLIDTVAPPEGCVAGQVLQFVNEEIGWGCVPLPSGGADGYNPDNEPTADVRGEPTRAEIESWGDLYDTDTDTHGSLSCTTVSSTGSSCPSCPGGYSRTGCIQTAGSIGGYGDRTSYCCMVN